MNKFRHVFTVSNYFTSSDIAHNMSIMKGDSFSSSDPVLRIFVYFRKSNIGTKYLDRCNFASIELSGYMFIRCK
jgi:hypothetical protein